MKLSSKNLLQKSSYQTRHVRTQIMNKFSRNSKYFRSNNNAQLGDHLQLIKIQL